MCDQRAATSVRARTQKDCRILVSGPLYATAARNPHTRARAAGLALESRQVQARSVYMPANLRMGW